uniref:ANK_REP_REGION domain-containing protein n=1 Tax=Anopheles atroparvus TaxID=41427 RepID=A0A182J872_ANOAO
MHMVNELEPLGYRTHPPGAKCWPTANGMKTGKMRIERAGGRLGSSGQENAITTPPPPCCVCDNGPWAPDDDDDGGDDYHHTTIDVRGKFQGFLPRDPNLPVATARAHLRPSAHRGYHASRFGPMRAPIATRALVQDHLAITTAESWQQVRRVPPSADPEWLGWLERSTGLLGACIDDNLDMVEFLVQKGADVNRKDNEGWTPLHATASCGFLSIARYLIENGADLAAINTDGELAVDLASSDAMEDLIQHHLDEQGIDCEEARGAEERIMLSDAKKWLRTDSTDCDKAHPKTGATAIHVAAAKGYISVLKLLLEGRGDIDRQDVDGWTPLHAAAYWGQKEATQLLLNASVDIDIQNYSGQLAIDIAHEDIVPMLKEARKNVKRTKRRPPSHGNRITDNFENNTETPTKVIRVEVKPIDNNKEKEEVSEKENQPTEPDVILRRTQSFENDEKSFVPPTRDEESETQRKAHAKRVRETRRSTQGVTLDEIKSAEQLVKKKNNVTGGSENTTTSSVVNDRVPSVGDAQSNNEQQQQQQSGNHVPCTVSSSLGGANSGSEKETTRDDASAEVVVSASFTLAAPASSSASGIASDIEREGGGGDDGGGGRRRRRSIPEAQEEDDSKVTVSYTISAPVRHASPSSRTGVGAPKETQDALSDVAAVSATFHVPQPPTASTRIRSISSTEVPSATPWSAGQERPASVGGNISASATIRTPAVTAGVVSNNDSSISTSAPSSANNTNNTVTTTTPATSSGGGHHNNTTTINSSSSYTKRSLFDIDNANSLTLAEKLRHEANKYAITASADGELDSSGHVLSSSRVPNSHQNAPTNSGVAGGGGGGSSEASETASAPADNSASASATVPPSPTLRKADPTATTAGGATAERRPSWRLKVDGGSKFKLEDASTPNAAIQSTSVVGGASYESTSAANEAPEHGSTTNTTTKLTASSALAQRRQQNGDSAAVAAATGSRPGLAAGEQYNRVPGSTSASATSVAAEAAAGTGDSSLLNLRRPPKSSTGSSGSSGPGGEENKENDKENDSRTAQATQAVIQRRRRQKRRSTGVVPLGMEDLDPDRQDSPVDGEEKEVSLFKRVLKEL